MPDLKAVKEELDRRGQTVYQFDFCELGDFESKKTRDAVVVPLPAQWATPLTTQRCSYRDPKAVQTLSAAQPSFSYKDNLVPNDTERRILRVRTGDSEYTAHIGALGEFVLREKLHGEGRRRAMSQWEVKRRLALLDQGVVVQD